MEMIRQLPIVERVRLHSMLKEPQGKTPSFEEYLTEQCFSNGRVMSNMRRHTSKNTMTDGRTGHRSSYAKTVERHFPSARTHYSAAHARTCPYGWNTWSAWQRAFDTQECGTLRHFREDFVHIESQDYGCHRGKQKQH